MLSVIVEFRGGLGAIGERDYERSFHSIENFANQLSPDFGVEVVSCGPVVDWQFDNVTDSGQSSTFDCHRPVTRSGSQFQGVIKALAEFGSKESKRITPLTPLVELLADSIKLGRAGRRNISKQDAVSHTGIPWTGIELEQKPRVRSQVMLGFVESINGRTEQEFWQLADRTIMQVLMQVESRWQVRQIRTMIGRADHHQLIDARIIILRIFNHAAGDDSPHRVGEQRDRNTVG